ncbi:copper(I)-binding protein [Variovorax boronicumulans]|uniref:copper chaperone PCu(A)C n=1 Tax=Variovorax boronicumulans TaxID=436515 RepID=UPI00278A119E|nr:copper chaperone PCu(A)C [Variovorax boronicumulans]MDP9994774.1 copper(I)-binding protein [Variovorax boronicumulans]MDQ0005884.1 copper(I)-binding protein [Variovorax boronicumulans]
MNTPAFTLKTVAACAMLAGAAAALAHVTLPPGGATVGSDYNAAFRVGHACEGATATTGLAVRLPKGFVLTDAQARKGWKLDVQKNAGDGEVRWTAETAQDALPGKERSEFVLRGKVPGTPGTLWFKVLQTCDVGVADWAEVPTSGNSTAGLKSPAAKLNVVAQGVATVDVRDGWVRQSVPGQSGTGAFMKLTAPTGAKLVGISTPAAGVAEVHEMKMEGDTMKMRELAGGLDLPAGQTVELKPGGYHVMMMDLKGALAKGATVPFTLKFEDAKGVKTALDVTLPVGAPEGADAGGAHQHKH